MSVCVSDGVSPFLYVGVFVFECVCVCVCVCLYTRDSSKSKIISPVLLPISR